MYGRNQRVIYLKGGGAPTDGRVYIRRVKGRDKWQGVLGCWISVFIIASLVLISVPLLVSSGSPEGASRSFKLKKMGVNALHHLKTSKHLRVMPRMKRHPLQRDLSSRIYRSRSNDNECQQGEYYDVEIQECLPNIRTPSALDGSIIDNSVAPCDDFYRMSCGRWLDSHEDESRSFNSIFKRNQHLIASLITQSDPEGPVRKFYQSCVESVVNKKYQHETMEQMNSDLNYILSGVRSHADLSGMFARLLKKGFPSLFSVQIENHPKKTKMIPLFRQDGFPYMDPMTDQQAVLDVFQKKYDRQQALLKTNMLMDMVQRLYPADIGHPNIAGFDTFAKYLLSPQGFSKDVMQFKDMKDQIMDKNRMFSFYQFLEELGGNSLLFQDDTEVWLFQKDWLFFFNISSFSLMEWKTFAEFSVMHSVLDFYPKLEDDVYFKQHFGSFEFSYNRIKPQWGDLGEGDDDVTGPTPGDCVHITHKMLPGLVSHQFSQENGLGDEDYDRVHQMVLELTIQYYKMIRSTGWMDDATKDRALEKIRAIKIRVGHPHEKFWPVEPFAKQISKDAFHRNLDLVRQYRVRRDLELWKNNGFWYDADEVARFGAPLSTVNAYYSPITNSITIFSGIMQYPFFTPGCDDNTMFAGLGAVIGHELSHGLDSHGYHYDARGNFRPWWRHSTEVLLKEKLACVAEKFVPPEECHTDPGYGNKTLGEDVADLVGVNMAFKSWFARYVRTQQMSAYRDNAMHWWMIYAQGWCASYSEEMACKRVNGDVHPLPSMRVTETLRNLPAFHQTFNCPTSSNMRDENICIVYGKPWRNNMS